jgi:hypothetical protein
MIMRWMRIQEVGYNCDKAEQAERFSSYLMNALADEHGQIGRLQTTILSRLGLSGVFVAGFSTFCRRPR